MKKSGVLLHITSLPSPGGIGTLGKDAYAFIDFLHDAGMSIWQVLPLGPVGYGESPYQSLGTHVGNPYLIDIPMLMADGLLTADADAVTPKSNATYDFVKSLKRSTLKLSYTQSFARVSAEVDAFCQTHPHVEEFALYIALQKYFDGKMWVDWPDMGIRMRDEGAIQHYRKILREEINFHRYIQYVFFQQWGRLKAYAHQRGILLFGDLPIYVAQDSADTWLHPEVFQLNRDRRPVKVAGVPPDYFCEDGQLWGNPLYDWKTLQRTHYRWWIERLKTAAEWYDMVRLDHFIGFANYYAVKANATTARVGKWEKAPGASFFRTVKHHLPDLAIVAEDLGVTGKRVKHLLRYCGFPGMRVLQFGFDSDEENPHFPENYPSNCVAYTGTHDNAPLMDWWAHAPASVQQMALRYLPERDTICDGMIEALLGSAADTVMFPMQDILHLGGEARMNYPGVVQPTNWRWRMAPGALTDELAAQWKDINEFYGRCPS